MKLKHWIKTVAIAAAMYAPLGMAAPQNLINIFNDVNNNGIAATATATVDLNSLVLDQNASLTAYFIGESAGARNAFWWYSLRNDGLCCQRSGRIWNNASAQGSGGSLVLGDEVALGNFSAGDELGFALYGRANNPRRWLFTHDQFNPGGAVQAVAGLIPNEGLLLLGWEDLYGPSADYDYTDLVVAIDIGVNNANVLAAGAPEPSQWLLLTVGTVALVGYSRRRQRKPTV